MGNLGECSNELGPPPPNAVTEKVALTAPVNSIKWGNTVTFTAKGGTPPYRYSVIIGTGSVDAAGVYTAPFGTGTGSATVRVVDSKYTNGTSTVDKDRKAEQSITITD